MGNPIGALLATECYFANDLSMTLEDHLGDIIRKARTAAGVAPETVAQASGLSLDELASLEQSGIVIKRPNYQAFAPLIDLNAAKLEKIEAGWLPAPVDFSVFKELRVFTTAGDDMTVNSYLIWDAETREAALFDTGFDVSGVIQMIETNGLQLQHLFITHSHEDHIIAITPLRERFPTIRLHSNMKSSPADQRNQASDSIPLGKLRITNRETPGHCEDGVTYIVENFPEGAPGVAIVGDCIFAGSMGRPNQSSALLKQMVRKHIFTLPKTTLVCSGHGPLTTIGEQHEVNPFF